MKHASLAVLLAAALLPASWAGAAVIGADGFDYPDGSVIGRNGGDGWAWRRSTGNQTGTLASWAANFHNAGGTRDVASGRLLTRDSSAARGFSATSQESVYNNNPSGGRVFYGVDMTWDARASWGGISAMDFGNEQTKFGVVFSGGTPYFGIESLTQGGWGGTNSGVALVDGQTYRIVAEVNFDSDVLRLWINPAADGEGSPNQTRTGFTTGNWLTGVRLGSGGSAPLAWDNVAIGTTFADVAIVPEPAAACLLALGGALMLPRRGRA